MADAAQDKIAFELVTPTALALSESADMVVVPGSEGDIGVLPGHTPLITTLRPGIVDVHNEGRVTQSLFVSGGFAEATPERCTILAEEVETLSEVTAQDAEARIAEARERLADASDAEKASAEEALRGAEALARAVSMRGR